MRPSQGATTPPLSQLRSLMYRMVYRHSTQLNTILPLAACASAPAPGFGCDDYRY